MAQIPDRPFRSGQRVKLDLAVAGSRIIWNCEGLTDWRFQTDRGGLAWPSGTPGVLTFSMSLNGTEWFTIGTQGSNTISAVYDVTAARFVCAEVTTAGVAAGAEGTEAWVTGNGINVG